MKRLCQLLVGFLRKGIARLDVNTEGRAGRRKLELVEQLVGTPALILISNHIRAEM